MHSLPPRTDSERTRKSWPSEIFTTSAALGSSAMHAQMMSVVRPSHAPGAAHARQTLPMTETGEGTQQSVRGLAA